MRKKAIIKRMISAFLIMFMFLPILSIISESDAKASGGSTWIIDDWYNNPYLYVNYKSDHNIVLWGEHHKKTNENYYETDYFVATKNEYVKSGRFPESAKDNVIHFTKKPVSDDESTVTMSYTIEFEDLVGMAGDLGITGESIGTGTVPIYLHMVFVHHLKIKYQHSP